MSFKKEAVAHAECMLREIDKIKTLNSERSQTLKSMIFIRYLELKLYG